MVGKFSNLYKPQIFLQENYDDVKDLLKSPLVPVFYNSPNCNIVCKRGISIGLMKAKTF